MPNKISKREKDEMIQVMKEVVDESKHAVEENKLSSYNHKQEAFKEFSNVVRKNETRDKAEVWKDVDNAVKLYLQE